MVFEHDKLVVTLGLYQATGKYPKLSIVSTIFLCIMYDRYDDTRKFLLKVLQRLQFKIVGLMTDLQCIITYKSD